MDVAREEEEEEVEKAAEGDKQECGARRVEEEGPALLGCQSQMGTESSDSLHRGQSVEVILVVSFLRVRNSPAFVQAPVEHQLWAGLCAGCGQGHGETTALILP